MSKREPALIRRRVRPSHDSTIYRNEVFKRTVQSVNAQRALSGLRQHVPAIVQKSVEDTLLAHLPWRPTCRVEHEPIATVGPRDHGVGDVCPRPQ